MSDFGLYNSLMEVVKKRRSLRQLKPDPIPDDYIDKIIEVARWAPSGFHTQPWEFVVVTKKELKDEIVQIIDEYRSTQFDRMETTREAWQGAKSESFFKHPMDYRNAPVFILVFGDTRTKLGLPMVVRFTYQKRDSIFNSTLANAFIYMSQAATTLGLGSHYVSAVHVPMVHCLLKDLLGIPRELEIYDMMALGYPAITPSPKFMRDKQKMIHYDFCGKDDFRTDEEVRDFIKKNRAWITATLHKQGPE